MWPDLQETADLLTYTEKMLDGKLHFLYSVCYFNSEITKFSQKSFLILFHRDEK